MKKILPVLVFVSFMYNSCTKDKQANAKYMNGVWIESSLRLDTLDFDKQSLMGFENDPSVVSFRSRPYKDITINPDYPVNHSGIYNYYLEGNKIFMRNLISSSTYYQQYYFAMASNQQSFTVLRFYGRKELADTIRFDRLR